MIRIGTCSWKYDSWHGLIYTSTNKNSYLREYSARFTTVEIDQWFWSLFPPDKVVLPQSSVIKAYTGDVPDDFKFTVKIPNSITLTHFYRKSRNEDLLENPHFLSIDIMNRFLDKLEPMADKIGILMFQFEYLNKQKMTSLHHFIDQTTPFFGALHKRFKYGLEIRNPNWLNRDYFNFIRDTGVSPVFLQGYYMPDIRPVYERFKDNITTPVVIRLHGPGRSEIEEKSGGNWDRLLEPKDDELAEITHIIREMDARKLEVYVNVNNHYEGSAPLTIEKIHRLL
jgi:uncharacterized protein YecE (DUF72 family)